MKIGVPKETAADERRVALIPDVAGRLAKSGLAVLVERGAGDAASFGDPAYQAAEATVVPAAADLFAQSDVVLKVQPPSPAEVRLCREGTALVAVFQPSAARDAVAALAARKVTAFSLALLPRITRAPARSPWTCCPRRPRSPDTRRCCSPRRRRAGSFRCW